jgi:hypothetical protein
LSLSRVLISPYKGHTVVATVKGGARFSGILATAPADNGELSVALHLTHALDAPSGAASEPKRALLILAKDLVELSADDVDVDRRTAQPPAAEAWKTDTDISGAATPGGNRPLQKWEAAPDEGAVAGGLEDDTKPSSRVWDQFSVNERLFGAKSNYEEELYTTKIDRTAKDFKEREKRAMQLAQEILSVSGRFWASFGSNICHAQAGRVRNRELLQAPTSPKNATRNSKVALWTKKTSKAFFSFLLLARPPNNLITRLVKVWSRHSRAQCLRPSRCEKGRNRCSCVEIRCYKWVHDGASARYPFAAHRREQFGQTGC